MLANLWFYRALWLTCYIETVFHVIDFLSLPKLVPQLCAFKKALVKNVEEAGTEKGGGGGERVTMKCLYFCYLVVQWPQTGQMGLIFNRNKALMWLMCMLIWGQQHGYFLTGLIRYCTSLSSTQLACTVQEKWEKCWCKRQTPALTQCLYPQHSQAV